MNNYYLLCAGLVLIIIIIAVIVIIKHNQTSEPFSNSNSIKNSYRFWHLILDVIFFDFVKTWCQQMDLGTPPGAQLNPKIAAKITHFSKDGGIFLKDVTDISPTRLRGRLRSAPGHHFFGFLMDFDIQGFFLIFKQILGINLGHRLARHPELACCFITKFDLKNKDLSNKM